MRIKIRLGLESARSIPDSRSTPVADALNAIPAAFRPFTPSESAVTALKPLALRLVVVAGCAQVTSFCPPSLLSLTSWSPLRPAECALRLSLLRATPPRDPRATLGSGEAAAKKLQLPLPVVVSPRRRVEEVGIVTKHEAGPVAAVVKRATCQSREKGRWRWSWEEQQVLVPFLLPLCLILAKLLPFFLWSGVWLDRVPCVVTHTKKEGTAKQEEGFDSIPKALSSKFVTVDMFCFVLGPTPSTLRYPLIL